MGDVVESGGGIGGVEEQINDAKAVRSVMVLLKDEEES